MPMKSFPVIAGTANEYDQGYEAGRSEAQVESRDPRINPLPGDELTTSTYKLRVVSIWVNETGTQKVYYKTTAPNTNYGEYAITQRFDSGRT
jgi:hypothetical protein